MKHICIGFAFAILAVAQATASEPAAIDLKDRDFTPEEIVRALVGRQETKTGEATNAVQSRKRGLGVVPSGQETATALPPRKVSMQLPFDLNSASLTEVARSRLDAVGQALQSAALQASRFIVSGHTDTSGRYDANLALSKRRAESVRDYLMLQHGVVKDRLVTVGKASDDLIDSGSPTSPANRRVQLESLD